MSSSTSGFEVPVQEKMKPCNVWSCNRLIKKSCVVPDLTSLKIKGREKLGISVNQTVRVVLEADGTEVDDDDYFQFLSDFSTFIFLTDLQEWCPTPSSGRMCSELFTRQTSKDRDSANGDSLDTTDSATSGDRVEELLNQLCTDSAYKQLLPWLLLRPADLEEIVNADPQRLYSKHSPQVVDQIQEMSSRALSDYNNAHKAVELLSLYDQATR